MKKLLGCFLCAMLLVFGAAASVQALGIDCYSDGSCYIGTHASKGNPSVSELETWFSVDIYESEFNDGLSWGSVSKQFDPDVDGDLTKGWFLNIPDGYEYLMVKYDGWVDLYDVSNCDNLYWTARIHDGVYHEYSPNARLFNSSTSVPDASVMLLLGSSFLGFAVFSRKRKKS